MANEPSEKNVQCTKCDKMFCTVDDLRRHEKSKHDWAPINCNSCDKVFSKNSDLEHHLEIEHEIEKTFQCDDCGMNFMLKWSLKKHMSIQNYVH